MKIPNRLNKEQQAAKDALVALLANRERADQCYNDLSESHGGRIISTDLARFLDTRYRDTPIGQPRDLAPSWDSASGYAQDRLKRELQSRRKRKVVSFMAGGWGAGKTHALDHAPAPDLAWDGTLDRPNWASEMIDLALTHGWQVDIAYVFRDIELAIYGTIERAKTEGRSVPLSELPRSHRRVQISIRTLLRRYRSNSQVSFTLLHNTGAKGILGTPVAFAETELG